MPHLTRPRRRRLLGALCLSHLAAVSWLGCGAQVAVDLPGGGGATTGSVTTGSGGGSGAAPCGSVPLVGDVESCPAPEDPAYCVDWTLCDGAGRRWEVKCGPSGCQCLVDDIEICTCAYPTPPCGPACCDAYYDYGAECCPYPWINHPGCKQVGDTCEKNADCCLYLCTNGHCDP